jgi:hypothetical protein
MPSFARHSKFRERFIDGGVQHDCCVSQRLGLRRYCLRSLGGSQVEQPFAGRTIATLPRRVVVRATRGRSGPTIAPVCN